MPVSAAPDEALQYSNLVYACTTCNEAKANILGLPDPCLVSFRECIELDTEGRATAKNAPGKRLCDVLRLNSPANVEYRSRMIRILEAFHRSGETELFQKLLAYPNDLPDLRLKLPPKNDKPEGASNCYFALRERGGLPSTY